MAIESFHSCEKFSIVTERDEDLVVVAHGGLKERQGAGGELVRFEEGDLVFGQFVSGFGLEFSGRMVSNE